MRVIYLDVLFALNFCMDFCILRAAAAFGGLRCCLKRMAAAAACGALYAAAGTAVPALSAVPLRVLSCVCMTAIAFDIRQKRLLLRSTLLVLLVSFVFGGCVTALQQWSHAIVWRDGVLYAQVSRAVLLGSALTAYGISAVVFRGQAEQNRAQGEPVCITYGAHRQIASAARALQTSYLRTRQSSLNGL